MTSPPWREDRKLDILENINYSVHETETCQGNAMSKIYSYKVFACCPVESIRVGSDADGVSDSGIILRTSS